MFGFSKKKKTAPQPEAPKVDPRREHFRAFAADFLPGEMTVAAVTGANSLDSAKDPDHGLWRAYIELTAWRESPDGEIFQGDFGLETLADDELNTYLRARLPRDNVIQFRARRSEDGKRLLLLDLPQPCSDPELHAILEEQKKEVTFHAEGLGTFSMNRQVHWFALDLEWLGVPIQMTVEPGTPEELEQALATARGLLADAPAWDARLREYAAHALPEPTGEPEGEDEVTREDLAEHMELEAIALHHDGGFGFWYTGGGLFWENAIHVEGTLESGPIRATMED